MEWPLTKYLENHVKEGHVVVDIGANVGYFTVFLAHLAGPEYFKHYRDDILEFETETARLDDALAHLPHIDMIKIDIEGENNKHFLAWNEHWSIKRNVSSLN
ncbi:class I SAM-dependent methyltransferase [Paenibacillus apiarius]|uniref:FkbM family methyltransferase n=1 Tax=Paenibacillus apiarius TaxID=46240 RepID=A0ABT4E2M3_9BACL|nr:hypothetical protein [Paenibacillus apiarius]MCY9516981.1 hypothetical protein [Paenibacillus apiarius]MCY9522783.1 hypothetical protein [Paenibacillus apiarius]MCY9554692.1 hypothetical protein [Paenibacillus apiarius]MCY9557323.1 hypothetical protein [Paenibacillus apiarius]MCY9682498.1 hypothetical protein [Paenibacillus apiarius]